MTLQTRVPLRRRTMTAAEFDMWVMRPENVEKAYELINGEVIEKGEREGEGPMVSNQDSSRTGATILIHLGIYLLENEMGRVTGEQGGYLVNGQHYIPDVGYMSYGRQPIDNYDAYNPLAPDLAVEVLTPTDDPLTFSTKIVNYLLAGTVVWAVNPVQRIVNVYAPGQGVVLLAEGDTLTGGDLLPGFALPLANIFKGRRA